MADNNTTGGGISAAGILGVVFICAKIFGIQPVASWSWWWVLCPFWIGFAIVVSIFGIIGLGALLVYLIPSRRR